MSTATRRLASRGLMSVAERIAAEHRVTVAGMLSRSKAPRASRVAMARVGLWLTLTEIHGLSTTETGRLTCTPQSTVANALSRTWATVKSGQVFDNLSIDAYPGEREG